MGSDKSRILMIQTGGTVGQEPNETGVLVPSDKNYMDRVPALDTIAHVDVQRTANIDSTNMGTSERKMLAEMIYKNHLHYDGFVIVHGTDTMADTAAALNYMIQNLGKPIVLTGAQQSIFAQVSDAPNNLHYAVKVATMDFGEVIISFGDKVVRGNRAIKVSEHSLNAFSSPRVQPVAEIGLGIMPAEHRIRRYNGDPILFTEFDTFMESYDQSSGTNTKIFENYVDSEDVHGILISAYGAGNIQDRLIPHIRKASEKGKPVLVVTNCLLGAADMGIYAVGSAPLEAGAISAGDLTKETAMQKLMYAVGRANKEGYQERERLLFVKTLIHREYAKDIGDFQTRFG